MRSAVAPNRFLTILRLASRAARSAARRMGQPGDKLSLALVHSIVAALVLTVAVGGGLMNFVLIARPMSEMVGGGSYGRYRIGEVAAMAIVLLETAMGLFFMESLGATRLLPVVGSFSRLGRVCMAVVAFVILTSMAGIECGIAFIRDLLLQDEMATSAALRGDGAVEAGGNGSTMLTDYAWLTRDTQMLLGAVLPFALMFAALPLETFMHSLRIVAERICAGCLHVVAGVMQTLSIAFGGVRNRTAVKRRLAHPIEAGV
jgi:hypothetical protein